MPHAGYTGLAEALPLTRPPARLVLQRGQRSAWPPIQGRVHNYMGDAFLALFGVSNEPEPTVAAIRAGLGVLEIAHDLATSNGTTTSHFGVSVGVPYSEAAFGLLGAEDTARETAIADVVDVASR